MKHIYKIYNSNKIRTILSIILFVSAIMFLLPQMSKVMEISSGTSITPDSDLWYSSQRLSEIKNMYGNKGISTYVSTRFSYDLLWPSIYFFFMVSTIASMTKTMNRNIFINIIYLLPIVIVAFDMMENITCSLYFNGVFENITNSLAPFFSGIKWLLVISVLIIQLVLFIVYIVSRVKGFKER